MNPQQSLVRTAIVFVLPLKTHVRLLVRDFYDINQTMAIGTWGPNVFQKWAEMI